VSGAVWMLLGAGMLVGGAELFAENVTSAARRVGLTALALGVLLAGAEPEEALTAGIASGRGHPQLAAGDALGANLVMLTLAVGLAAVFTALPVSRRVGEYAGAAALAGLAALVLLLDGRVGRAEGGLLVVAYVLVVGWVWWRERRPPAVGEVSEAVPGTPVGDASGTRYRDALPSTGITPAPAEGEVSADDVDTTSSTVAVLLVVVGVALMVAGGWLAVTGAERLVTGLGLDDTGVGLTLLALATSAEMLALVFAATRRRVAEVALAGLVGAVFYNATVSLGVGALVAPLHGVGGPRFLVVAAACALLSLAPLVLARSRVVARWSGATLVVAYVLAVPVLLA
jgi:cation:H+ antiporter